VHFFFKKKKNSRSLKKLNTESKWKSPPSQAKTTPRVQGQDTRKQGINIIFFNYSNDEGQINRKTTRQELPASISSDAMCARAELLKLDSPRCDGGADDGVNLTVRGLAVFL
jgi:hypothetical protein